jgi:hypothetical protein
MNLYEYIPGNQAHHIEVFRLVGKGYGPQPIIRFD